MSEPYWFYMTAGQTGLSVASQQDPTVLDHSINFGKEEGFDNLN